MYSNSANGAKSSWIVRTSTPKKMSVYDFDPGRPSTSFEATVNLHRLDSAGQSNSKPNGRNRKPKGKKGSIISMICEAIEAVGLPNKGASYIAIHKWITNNRENGHTRNLRTLIKKEIAKGLKLGLLKRSSVSKKSVGVKGFFIINENYSSHNSKKSAVIPKLMITRNANRVKPNQVETARSIQKSQEDPQSVLAAIMKTKEAFEETAQSILQQASKILEVATKLMEASNSLVLNKVSEQNRDAINPDVEMQCVVPMQSRQDEEARVVAMQFPQGGQVRVAPVQSSSRENIVAQNIAYQAEKERVAPISKDEEVQVAPTQLVQGEARVAPTQLVQGEARVAPMQLAQCEVRVAPMQLVQGEARVAPMQLVQGEARVYLTRIPQIEHNVAPMQSSGAENRVNGTYSPQDEVASMEQRQIGEVASVQHFPILETEVTPKQSPQTVDSKVDHCSSTSQNLNNSPRQGSLDKELSVQRNLDLSLDFSFGVGAEVSNLIEHLEENI